MEPEKKRTWLWIVVGVLGVVTVGCFAVVGTGMYLVSRQMQVTPTDSAQAGRELEAARARFQGQPPLITIDDTGHASDEALRDRVSSYSGPLPSAIHVLAWDPDKGRLVRFSMPFWMLRLGGSRGQIQVEDFDFQKLHVTAEDLERAGPALLLDHQRRDARVVVWSE